jgi:hypothetical protein
MATAQLEAQGYTAVPLNVDITRGDEARKVTWVIHAPFSELTADAVGGGAIAAELTGGVATVTTDDPHGLSVGDWVVVASAGEPFNGSWAVESVPSTTTFTFRPSHDDIAATADVDGTATKRVATTLASLTGNVVTLTTATPHGYVATDSVVVAGISATYNGTFTVVDAPTTTTLTYAKVNADVAEAAATSGTISKASGGGTTSKTLVDNVATITTASNHGLIVGNTVVVASCGDPFDGTWVITAKTNTTFSYSLEYADIASGVVSGTVTATATKPGEVVSAVLTPDLTDPGTTSNFTVSGESASASKTYETTDKRKDWKIEVTYYTRETVEAQDALQNYRLEQADVVAQIPVASEVERNQRVTLIRARKAVVTGTVWPQVVGDDWSIIDAGDYAPALQFGIFTGTDPVTGITSGPQSAVGIAGSLGGSIRGALLPGDRVEVDNPDTTPTTAAGFIPAYNKVWWKDEYITLVPTNAGIAASEDVEEFYWDGTVWQPGVNGSGAVLPKIASAAVVAGGASLVKDADGATITVSGLTLAQLRRLGGLPTTTRWPEDTYITITADVTAGTANKAHWDGQKWANGDAPADLTPANPYDGYSG